MLTTDPCKLQTVPVEEKQMLCCERCVKHNNCVKQWMLGEKGLSQTCCFDCPDFSECFEENMKKRWEIVHGVEFGVQEAREMFTAESTDIAEME